jgi:hypothetical protein
MMVVDNPVIRTAPKLGRCLMRRKLAGWLALCALAAPAPTLAAPGDKDDKPDLPRLGLDAGEPQVRSAPPAIPFAIPPATSSEYVLDFHGYLLLPMNLGLHDREDPLEGQSGTVFHTPPLVPQNYRRFQYTGVVPDPWVQLNFTYGNSQLAGTVILAATSVTEAEAVYDPVRQLGVSDAFVTMNLTESVGTPFQLRVGAMTNRYGAMGAFDSGRYATPLIGRINSIGETVTAGFEVGESTAVVLEQGIGGQLGRMPAGFVPSGWNDFSDPNTGASFVSHLHGGISHAGLLQFGLHYITAWSQDDQNLDQSLPDGRITVLGADARLTAGRYGHLYLGGAYTQAVNSEVVSGIVEVLNARGGRELTAEYLGPDSNGDGSLMTFGMQYDLSLSKLLYEKDYRGNHPDVLLSLFGIGTKIQSDDPDFDDVLKLKTGFEATYNLLSWFGVSGRADHVRLDHEFNRRAFNILTARALFHSGWLSRDELAIYYSHFIYGREVAVAQGYPPVDDLSLNPDRHVLGLSATFWW